MIKIMTRSKLSFLAAAWLLAAYQVEAGPIATAADNAATSSELASLGGLLQALGAGVIGNGALLYPTAASSHQRAEAEILASDTATRVFKKVKSILKEGGINDDEEGGDESAKSVTYLVKPALIFHKEELPPPNPLAGNVLPLPGGALLYTPTPTAGANGEATSGPAASIKAAYGNLFAASPYTPSYTLNKPHAAVIVEEVTDMLSLKSMQQRLEDAGEDEEEEDDEEDEYGRKKKGKKNVKFVSLETIDSTSAFINPFTRADFPFGLMTPPAAPTQSKKESEEPKTSTRKTIKKMLSAKPTSTAASTTSAQINASLGKDGGITIVANNLAQATSSTIAPGTTIIIPPASLTSSASNASSASSSASPASSSVSIHEDSSRNDDVKANEVGRMAHTSPAMPDMGDGTSVKGNRRDAATCDPLASSGMSSMSGITDLAQATNMRDAMESPVGTVGSSTEWHAESSATQASASEVPKHRKMHIVRVFEVKKNKSSLISGSSSSASAQSSSSSGEHVQKRDIMPLYDSPESTSMLEANPMDTPMLAESYSTELIAPNTYPPNTYPEPVRMAPTVSNWQRMIKESANDNDSESDSDDEQGSKKLDSDAEKVRDILSMSKDNVSPTATDASASSSSASVESTGTASAESSSASVESSSASVESTGTASAESSSASVNSSSASAESSSASAESSSASAESTGTASAESSSVSGDVKVEAASASTSASGNSASASTSASGDSASASSSAQSTKATAQSTSSVSAQSSSATAHSTSSVSAKKSGTAMTSSTSHAANSSSRSLSIEDIGAQETSVAKGSASEEAESDKKSESDSDSDSEGESGVEKHNADERDASEEGDSESSDNESEIAKNEDSDDEEASPRTKVGSKGRLAIVPIGTEGDSLMAIQRVAALGLREAEKAVEEFEKHSDAPEIEALTTQDEKPAMTSSASELAATQSIAAAEAVASRSVASALSAAMSSLGQRASESASQSPVRAAAHKDRDDDSDDDKDDDDEKDEKRSKKEDSDDDDDDSDNDKGKSENSDDDTDGDSDSGSDKKSSRRKKSSDGKQARGEFDKEANAARKAVSDAAAESAQQVVKATATELDAMATDSASADGDKAERRALSEAASESAQQAVKVTATELDDAAATDSAMTDGSAVGRDVASASEDDMEFETNKGVNSDGEEVQFVTQLVADERQDKADRAKANESPSIVVMASIDEEYEEDYYTKPHASGARRSAHVADNASNAIAPSRVQRNAVNAMNDVDDVYDEGDKVVRGVEPTPDLSIIKESQNRAINIGLGNLRRHV
ncbi:hypothetical protein GGI17_000281 [Coemansia sp. S146]|nr:hypothetical protein GGI17_000281 [Coemansia sp. S146]